MLRQSNGNAISWKGKLSNSKGDLVFKAIVREPQAGAGPEHGGAAAPLAAVQI